MTTKRTHDLLSYFDRLIAAERSEYHCQREITEVISELKSELKVGNEKPKEDAEYVRFRLAVKELSHTGGLDRNAQRQLLLTNKTLYQAYKEFNGDKIDLFFGRCSGVTTSLRALSKAFDNVYVATAVPHGFGDKGVKPDNLRDKDLKGCVLFVDAGANFYEHVDFHTNASTVIKCHSVDSLNHYETKENGIYPYKEVRIN